MFRWVINKRGKSLYLKKSSDILNYPYCIDFLGEKHKKTNFRNLSSAVETNSVLEVS